MVRGFDIPLTLQFKKLACPSSPQKFTYKPVSNYSHLALMKNVLLTKKCFPVLLPSTMFQSFNSLEAQ